MLDLSRLDASALFSAISADLLGRFMIAQPLSQSLTRDVENMKSFHVADPMSQGL